MQIHDGSRINTEFSKLLTLMFHCFYLPSTDPACISNFKCFHKIFIEPEKDLELLHLHS